MCDTPVGWRSFQLINTGTWLSGGTPYTNEPRYWNGDIPWISAASLRDFQITSSERCVTQIGVLAGTRLVPPGTVLFVVRGMSLKSELRIGVTERPVAFGQDCKAIIPAKGIEGKFLALAIKAQSHRVLGMVDEAGHGTGRLPTDLISRLSIGIPDLPEQNRITIILDSVDKEVKASLRLIAKLERLRTALIRESMRAGLDCFRDIEASELHSRARRTAGSWALVPLDSVLAGIDAGHSPDLEDTPAGPGQWGVLKVSAVGNGEFHPEENKVVRDQALHNHAICVHPGDLLITRANTSKLVGRSCIVHGGVSPRLMLCDKTLRLRVAKQSAPAQYVHIVLGLAEVRRQIEIAATGTSGSMKNISQAEIRRLMIPIGRPGDIDRVVEADATLQAQVAALHREVNQLRSLRAGLMDDLLTGRARVADGWLESVGTG
jgi:restriction endonuclease S subunit